MAMRRSNIDFSGLLMPAITSNRQRQLQDQSDDVIVRFKPGGYPDDMFVGLREDERRIYECNICFLVAKDPRQCINSHLFCATCIFTWTLSTCGDNRDKCPVCRSPGRYKPDIKRESRLNRKRVTCTEDRCRWKGTLSSFKKHWRNVHADSGPADSVLPPVIVPSMNQGYSKLNTSTESGELQWRVVREPHLSADGSHAQPLDPQAARNRRRLRHLFHEFSTELQQRRQNIDEHYRVRETYRRDQLNEVESLGRRLDDVSADLDRLMSNMSRDSSRYHGYIRTSIDMEDSLLALSQSFPDTGHSVANSTRNGLRRRARDAESCATSESGSGSSSTSRGDAQRNGVRGVDEVLGSVVDQQRRSSTDAADGVFPLFGLLSFRSQDSHGERSHPDRCLNTSRRLVESPRHDTLHSTAWTQQSQSMLPLRRNTNNVLNPERQQQQQQQRRRRQQQQQHRAELTDAKRPEQDQTSTNNQTRGDEAE